MTQALSAPVALALGSVWYQGQIGICLPTLDLGAIPLDEVGLNFVYFCFWPPELHLGAVIQVVKSCQSLLIHMATQLCEYMQH